MAPKRVFWLSSNRREMIQGMTSQLAIVHIPYPIPSNLDRKCRIRECDSLLKRDQSESPITVFFGMDQLINWN